MADDEATSNRKVKIHRSDVPDDVSGKIIASLNEALDKFQIEKDMATHVKRKCDEVFGGTWHCIVGRNFGCSITHHTKYVLFFQVDLMHVMCFKSLD